VRGEHRNQSFDISDFVGSPPRAWGTWNGPSPLPTPARFTPTCVRNIPPPGGGGREAPVHPHVRGEHAGDGMPVELLIGSPPRAWGTFVRNVRAVKLRRFTPTCVGNIPLPSCSFLLRAVHPHVRGEHRISSRVPRLAVWFTPTCVGNMERGRPSESRRSVHPHVRGEHRVRRCRRVRVYGSPPRAWGTSHELRVGQVRSRFTPTCVGNMSKQIDLISY